VTAATELSGAGDEAVLVTEPAWSATSLACGLLQSWVGRQTLDTETRRL